MESPEQLLEVLEANFAENSSKESATKATKAKNALLLYNPQDKKQKSKAQRLQDYLGSLPPEQAAPWNAWSDHLFFLSSGSSASPKWVAISKKALRHSAEALNRELSSTSPPSNHHWSGSLPLYHVGGLATFLRSLVGGGKFSLFEQKWSADCFAEHCEKNSITHCSLVPAQLYDIYAAKITAPQSIETTLIGGDNTAPELLATAQKLGWQPRLSYGMTEASSTIALSEIGKEQLTLLPHWKARCNSEQGLEIQGESLFSAYFQEADAQNEQNAQWEIIETTNSDPSLPWFATSDRAALDGSKIEILGRQDELIKILGEKSDLSSLRKLLLTLGTELSLPLQSLALLARQDTRRGHRLCLAYEPSIDKAQLDNFCKLWRQKVAPYEALEEADLHSVEKIPCSDLGKIRYPELLSNLESSSTP